MSYYGHIIYHIILFIVSESKIFEFLSTFQFSPISDKPRLHSKSIQNLKRTFIFLCLLREKKKVKSRDPLKAFEERGAPTVNFHARMIEGFYRKSAECPFFQLAAASSPPQESCANLTQTMQTRSYAILIH